MNVAYACPVRATERHARLFLGVVEIDDCVGVVTEEGNTPSLVGVPDYQRRLGSGDPAVTLCRKNLHLQTGPRVAQRDYTSLRLCVSDEYLMDLPLLNQKAGRAVCET